MKAPTRAAVAAVAGYTAAVAGTNILTSAFGVVTVAGQVAPAGVLLAGAVFSLRDLCDDLAGRRAVLGAVAAGTAVSVWLANPALAFASGFAFAVSEAVDMGVYWPLRSRGRLVSAIVFSNIAGLVTDSLAFLWLAFGSLAMLPGQIAGKALMTVIAVAALLGWRRLRGRTP